MRRTDSAAQHSQPILFDLEEIGLSLREVAVDVVRVDQVEMISRWFHSKQDADLMIWMDGSQKIVKHQVSFLGQVVEWNCTGTTKTGVIIEEELGDLPSQSNEVIRFDAHPQSQTVEQAIRLIGYMTEIKEDEKELLMGQLRSPIKKPALSIAENNQVSPGAGHTCALRPSFWKRLRNWVSG